MEMNIEEVPSVFQVLTNHEYPPHNKMIFEEYFLNYFLENNIDVERIYLPILWTNFYIERNYGNDDMSDLQTYLNELDTSKKYFTVIQYDDGILQHIGDLDIFIFGAGGGGRKYVPLKNLDYPIPLICQPNPNANKNRDRDILVSFVGTIAESYTIRQKLRTMYGNSDSFFIREHLGYKKFTETMERSIFSLCPRGYGATSFRICEALQHGSIPVYVFDKAWVPWLDEFDFNEIGIWVHEFNIGEIESILRSKTEEEISEYRINGQRIYEEYFTFEGCAKQIIKKLCLQ